MAAGDDLSALTEAERNDIVRHKSNNLAEYYLTRIAKWCRDQWQLDTRFTPLTLSLDRGEADQGQRLKTIDGKFSDLNQILTSQSNYLAFVLLGSPGSGKSTLLQHLEWQTALTAVQTNATTDTPIPFFVSLNQYKTQFDESQDELSISPWRWLRGQWQALNPGLADLNSQMRSGRMWLLLDALNEMPHTSDDHYQSLLKAWQGLLREINEQYPGNRLIFSCRELDYSIGLSSPDNLSVPHIRIESLDDGQILSFLEKYQPQQAKVLYQQLKEQQQLKYYRIPYFLYLLIGQVDGTGDLPKGRAALFTGFVRQVLKRELEKSNSVLNDTTLLTPRERTRLTTNRWGSAYQLPEQGKLFPPLQTLAFKMQQQLSGEESAQVVVDLELALKLLDGGENETFFDIAVALGLLDESELLCNDKVKYRHQLFQEYFAARQLAKQPQPDTVASPWQKGELKPTLEETLASLADYEPLPPPPSSPWYETSLIAAPMATSPEDFIRQIMAVNLPLAGRCAAQPEMDLSPDFVDQLRQQLLQRMQNTKADLRARITAGKALGELGDPRLIRHQGEYGDYLLPRMITIPGGTYSIGSDEGLYEDESPAHTLILNEFAMAQTPVTNAEWALFMAAGGYDNEKWWPTVAAKAWRRGENTDEGPKQQWRKNREYYQTHPDFIRSLLDEGGITSKEAEELENITKMSDDEFELLLVDYFPGNQQYRRPNWWLDSAFNNLTQPVVGISWYEALAYCTWLSVQTGLCFQLPSEAQWEAAARGESVRTYAWGDKFENQRCNSFESYIRATTPVGLFSEGVTSNHNLADMSGNVWEWTRSLYRDYPYKADDRREDVDVKEGRRVVRGGSWDFDYHRVRCVYRGDDSPVSRLIGLGFRLSCVSPIR